MTDLPTHNSTAAAAAAAITTTTTATPNRTTTSAEATATTAEDGVSGSTVKNSKGNVIARAARRHRLEETLWQTLFELWVDYPDRPRAKVKYGKAVARSKYPTRADDRLLAEWIHEQRRVLGAFQQGKFCGSSSCQKRIEQLNEAGFDWDYAIATEWDEKFEKLLAFHQETGHCRVPKKHKQKDLVQWVQLQREHYQKLTALGFDWDVQEAVSTTGKYNQKQQQQPQSSEQAVAALPLAHEMAGPSVPMRPAVQLALPRLAGTKRPAERVVAPDTCARKQPAVLARAYHAYLNHTNTTNRPVNNNNQTVDHQERAVAAAFAAAAASFNNHPLAAQPQPPHLGAVGASIGRPIANLVLPLNHKVPTATVATNDDSDRESLDQGVIAGITADDESESLPESAQVENDEEDDNNDEDDDDNSEKDEEQTSSRVKWDAMFDELMEYKKNHIEGKIMMIPIEVKSLFYWTELQRRLRRRGQLEPRRVKKLESIQFIWDVKEERWDEKFRELLEFQKKCGHCNPKRKRKGQDTPLSLWVDSQRSAERRGKLTKRRIDLLNSIGFRWADSETKLSSSNGT